MARYAWGIKNITTNVTWTSSVLSFNFTNGRQSYLDNYSAGASYIDNKQSTNFETAGFNFGENRFVKSDFMGSGNAIFSDFWVQKITYNDYPGNTGLSTATFTCVDWISRAGRINTNNLVIAQADCDDQLTYFETAGILPADMGVIAYGSGSIASGTTYTGTVNNYLNFLVTTERGYCFVQQGLIYFIGRTFVSSLAPIATTIGRTASDTQIAYQQLERIANGFEFINTATVSPNGLASQTSTNTTSVSTYGPAFYSSSTVDYTTTQASGNADWIVNNFGDPTAERFFCSFTDLAQNGTALYSWLAECFDGNNRTVTFKYRQPGDVSDLSENVVMEGYTINVTPEQTTFDLSFSPLTYYQFFTLNSSLL
jgi:hypothetical protein